ncbi:hypothetical protein SKAU_G00340970 [Synaphobranchus kaupii]|uniref:Uncharacterized protein n=1 Tax=Synaphobranchus kaupii TaxID=118154 RepID=A0A9Q1IJF0_SYNKA|nr:hypothetical protein SKAU_G00340970 [Synaphobranchus kaupii]
MGPALRPEAYSQALHTAGAYPPSRRAAHSPRITCANWILYGKMTNSTSRDSERDRPSAAPPLPSRHASSRSIRAEGRGGRPVPPAERCGRFLHGNAKPPKRHHFGALNGS